ncbi:helix-turn-helix transcriptional regulator [Phototrophicus methaneseepsis]|uniref:Helix-turn-helix transcriptional regulator n=1 Tax=Phototrophicus methaneseepsis TaxID=2710758 RepID=A0A7S8E8E2_9CHLR|nr:helix-turn-helix domain-containing protein [Phototrophicus methaneseepsis]QPC82285.1 helix-turn-helix transcriptional regulator [Phototrophicus methaneseepsis]
MTDPNSQNPLDVPGQLDFTPAEEHIVDDLDTLKVLADPLRLHILELMEDPCTVKQVAEALDLPPTKLYYHITQLQKHGLIVVVETRIVSGIIEKHYQVAARRLQVAAHLLSPGTSGGSEGLTFTLNTFFDDIRVNLQESLASGLVAPTEDAPAYKQLRMYSGRLHLTQDQAVAFLDRMKKLVDEYEQLSEEQAATEVGYYKYMYVGFPSSRRPRTEKQSHTDPTADE